MWVITFEVKFGICRAEWAVITLVFPFMFSCGYLGLFLFLVVCVHVHMCCFHCLGVVLFSIYLCWWCCGSLPHNEDIVTLRCGGGESRSLLLLLLFEFSKKKPFCVFLRVLYYI